MGHVLHLTFEGAGRPREWTALAPIAQRLNRRTGQATRRIDRLRSFRIGRTSRTHRITSSPAPPHA